MKRVFALGLVILALCSIASCSEKTENTSTYDEISSSVYAEDETTEYITSVTETATLNTTEPTVALTKASEVATESTDASTNANVENSASQIEATEGHTHSYAVATFKANCTKDGYSLYSCHCGASYESDYVDALGHKWGSWETVKEATTESEGKKQRTCDRCGKVESESIDKLLGPYDVPAVDNVDLLCERVLYYINIYREYDTFSPAELEHYAFIRAEQVISNYAHDENDMKAAREESGVICSGECIGRVSFSNSCSIDEAAQMIVEQFRNSSGHWNILTNPSYGCMSIGVAFSWGHQCYTCIAVA